MSSLDADIATAKRRLFATGQILAERAEAHTDVSDLLVDRIRVIAMCMDLPGDMPLRIAIFPNAFGLQA